MEKNPLSLVANTGLALTAVALLVGPLALGQLLGSYKSGALGESTTAQQQAMGVGNLSVRPNSEEFSPYVEFDPNPLQEVGFYQTSITLTSFTKQQAAYNSLLLLTNTGAEPMHLQAEVGTMSGVVNHSEVWLSLVSAGGASSTLTTASAAIGQQQLSVGQNLGFETGHIVADGRILVGSAAGKSAIALAKPLTKAVGVGEKVYLGSAYYKQSSDAMQPTTSAIKLLPGEQASIGVVVATTEGDLDTNQLVIPVTVRETKGF